MRSLVLVPLLLFGGVRASPQIPSEPKAWMELSIRDYAFQKPERLHRPSRIMPSAERSELLLDSTYAFQWDADRNIWKSLERLVFAYDSLGQIKEKLYQRWDRVKNGFADVEKTVWTYGPGNFLQEVLYWYWDLASQDWQRAYRQVYYDLGYGRIIEEDGLYWDAGSRNWLNDYRLTRTFTQQGYLIEMASLIWNPDFRIWSNYAKFSWTYKTPALLHQLLYQRWNDGHWNDIDRYVYHYNDEEDPTLLLYQQWFGTWSDRERYTFTYDEQDNLIEYRYQDWNRLTEKWLDQYLETYTYDPLGNRANRMSSFVPAGSTSWVNYRNDVYVTDERGFTTEETTEYWDERWIKSYKYLRGYDEYSHLTDSTSQYWDDFHETWVNNFRMQRYYSEHSIATTTAEYTGNATVSVFPNPVQEKATFVYPSGKVIRIEIYDATGILKEAIEDTDLNGQTIVFLDRYPAGAYLYKVIHSGAIISSGKVIRK